MATLEERYFNWMTNIIYDKRHSDYKKLLKCLNDIEFTYLIEMDGNRESDGINLRYMFGYENDIPDPEITKYLDNRQCSVFEMMVSLSLKMEDIMEDPDIGDQIPDWFWTMIRNLRLEDMNDRYFDKEYVEDKIDIFLNREYEPNGKGGLFELRRNTGDLRGVEIWVQAMWYLDEVISERR